MFNFPTYLVIIQLLHYSLALNFYSRTYQSRLSVASSSKLKAQSQWSDVSSLDTLKPIVEKYMAVRKTQQTGLQITTNQRLQSTSSKASNPLEFLQPTGWFRDKIRVDLENRSDKTTPLVPHPLSFVELEKFGFQDLSPHIISFGGPQTVGKLLGIEWQEPAKEKPIPKQKVKDSPKPGMLALGGSFEESLEKATMLDMSALKSVLISNNGEDYEDSDTLEPGLRRYEGEDYTVYKGKRTNIMTTKVLIEKKVPSEDREEKFRLVGPERLYALLVLYSGAGGNGRSSANLISLLDQNENAYSVIQTLHTLFPLLCAISAITMLRAAITATEKNRNGVVWASRALLGGPLVLIKLQSLPLNPTVSGTTSSDEI